MTAIQVKLSDDRLQKLRSRTGITADFAAQALGVGVKQAARLLTAAGAKRSTDGHGKWKMVAE